MILRFKINYNEYFKNCMDSYRYTLGIKSWEMSGKPREI